MLCTNTSFGYQSDLFLLSRGAHQWQDHKNPHENMVIDFYLEAQAKNASNAGGGGTGGAWGCSKSW
jgi:hypothetical protein